VLAEPLLMPPPAVARLAWEAAVGAGGSGSTVTSGLQVTPTEPATAGAQGRQRGAGQRQATGS
jgi:hypothetical protein